MQEHKLLSTMLARPKSSITFRRGSRPSVPQRNPSAIVYQAAYQSQSKKDMNKGKKILNRMKSIDPDFITLIRNDLKSCENID